MLRVIFINSSPPSLYGDELTIALDANSLLKTGHDQLGHFLPLTFQMGAGRPAGYVYGSIPFIALFGLTPLGVRGLSILSGFMMIILIYSLTRKIFSEKTALITAFIVSVSPWDISLSRGGFEAHFALFLALLGVYLFIKAKERSIFYIFSALSFGLTLHTYPTYKLSLLLFLPLLVWFQEGLKSLTKRNFLIGTTLFVMLVSLSLNQTFFAGSETRFLNLNIFSNRDLNQQIVQKINLERSNTKLPENLRNFFHNKEVEYTKVFIENYLQNFSLDFLILHGDRNPRHNMATMGEIYFVELLLILSGILIYWSKHKKIITFLILWIFVAPVPTAIVDLPHALRSSFMLPPLIILSSLGLGVVLEQKRKYMLFLGILFLIQFVFFLQKLYFLAPFEYASFWAYPGKVAAEVAIENKNMYDYVVLSDRIDSIEFAYPVYAKLSPQDVIEQNKNKTKLGEYYFKKFDNIYIGSVPEVNLDSFWKDLPGKILYIGIDKFNKLVFLKKGV